MINRETISGRMKFTAKGAARVSISLLTLLTFLAIPTQRFPFKGALQDVCLCVCVCVCVCESVILDGVTEFCINQILHISLCRHVSDGYKITGFANKCEPIFDVI